MRHVLPVVLVILCALSAGAYDMGDSLKKAYASPDGDPVEGVWQLAPEGAVIGIRATAPNQYEMVLVDSPAPSLMPGTVVGTFARSSAPSTYDGRLMVKKGRFHNFTIVLDDEAGVIRFYEYRKQYALNLWRLVPRLFRYSVRKEDSRPGGTDGALRLYPRPAIINPVVL